MTDEVWSDVRKGRYSWEEPDQDGERARMASYVGLRGWDTDDDPDDDTWWNKRTGDMTSTLEKAYAIERARGT